MLPLTYSIHRATSATFCKGLTRRKQMPSTSSLACEKIQATSKMFQLSGFLNMSPKFGSDSNFFLQYGQNKHFPPYVQFAMAEDGLMGFFSSGVPMFLSHFATLSHHKEKKKHIYSDNNAMSQRNHKRELSCRFVLCCKS